MSDYKCTREWWIATEKTFSVSVVAWERGYDDLYGWNVYAYVFKDHPYYEDNDWLKNLPFHGGCTLDQIITKQPFNIEYDFQSVQESKKVGSDYMHLYDVTIEQHSPENGIPYSVLTDALELVESLKHD